MSIEWDGNLLNSPANVVIDSVALIFTVCSYAPQVLRLLRVDTIRGISTYYILFNVLFGTAQLSQVLIWSAHAWPTSERPVLEQIHNGQLTGLAALGGILGLLQIFVQWACSITVLFMLALKGARTAPIIALLHAALVLFPIVATTLPRRAEPSWEVSIRGAFIIMSNIVVAPVSIILQFYAQIRESKAQDGIPGALSLLSLRLQVLAFATLAVRWLLRVGRFGYDLLPFSTAWYVYQWAFPAVNCAMLAVGYAILLACYRGGRGEQGVLGERMPLIR